MKIFKKRTKCRNFVAKRSFFVKKIDAGHQKSADV
jgi:hypothetical protein